ncbi:MAG: hypothetical protein JNM66_00295 [Bryobacterales bacterium]|nr:hypothetical protein [Bryobacterales bacterium]
MTALIVAAYWMLADAAAGEQEAGFRHEVMIVAAAAATIKPTALFLLLFIAVLAFTPMIWRRQWSGFASLGMALAIPSGVLCYATWRASGSLLFPSPVSLLILPTPWTIPSTTCDLFSSVSREWNRRLLWIDAPPGGVSSPGWLAPWIVYYWPHVASIAGVFAVSVAAFWRQGVLLRDRPFAHPLVLAALLSLFGTAYWFILGAAPRLGIGYTILPLVSAGLFSSQRLLALLAVTFALLPLLPAMSSTQPGIALVLLLTLGVLGLILAPSSFLRHRRPQMTVLLLSAFAGLAMGRECAITLRARVRSEGIVSALLVPPHFPAIAIRTLKSADVEYVSPATGDLCWAAPLPCTPYLSVRQIALLRPERGIEGGVKIIDPAVPEGFLNASRIPATGK